MFKKKFISILLSTLMIIGTFAFSQITVNAAGTNGWSQSNGTWYYYNNGTLVKNGWKLDSHGWCFLNAIDGSWVQEGWAKDSTGWGYIQNGYWVQHSTWAKDSTGWLHIGGNGYWDGGPAVSSIPTENATIAAPTGVTANAISTNQIQVQWNALSGVDYYYVYYCDSLNGNYRYFTNADSSKQCIYGCSAKMGSIPEDTKLYFKVTAVSNGVESKYSNIVYAATISNVKHFPLLSTVPMPANASYYDYSVSDGTVAYFYSYSTLPSDFINEYYTLLENNGWVLSKTWSVDEENPCPASQFTKGGKYVLILFTKEFLTINGNI